MNELQIFYSEEFGDIRTVTIDEEVWFVGKDVAEALGYSNSSKAVSVHVGEEDRILKVLEADSQNGNVVKTQTALINESGLYALIFGSKLESAKRFKHWVTSEVLPAIRKNGSYQLAPQGEELLALAVIEAKKTIDSLKDQCKFLGEQWVLYSKHQNNGYVHSRTIDITRADGRPDVTMQTEWTQKGRLFLYEELKKHGYVPVIEQVA